MMRDNSKDLGKLAESLRIGRARRALVRASGDGANLGKYLIADLLHRTIEAFDTESKALEYQRRLPARYQLSDIQPWYVNR